MTLATFTAEPRSSTFDFSYLHHSNILLCKLAMSSSPGNAKATAPIPSSKPVDILQTQLSLLYANLHPILLLSILLFSFRSLVEDPVNTLLGLAPTVAIVQALYCVLCLPSTGQIPAPAPKPGQKKKAAKPAQDIWAKVVVRHLKKTRCGL